MSHSAQPHPYERAMRNGWEDVQSLLSTSVPFHYYDVQLVLIVIIENIVVNRSIRDIRKPLLYFAAAPRPA